MVFVTLGTQDKEFPRLLKEVEKLIDKGIINEEVVAQVGSTNYSSDKIKIVDYLSRNEVLNYIKNSKYVITHGGVGTIIDSINLGKKVIAVPRLKKYKEHVNDHQLEIVNEFSKLGFILDGSNLEQAIYKLDSFIPKKYKSNNSNFVELIDYYINNKKKSV